MKRVLILGGTGDANRLAAKVARLPDRAVVTSLAGRTQNPTVSAGQMRVGGFGGVQGLANYLQAEKIDLLVDATHPFAAQISWNAAAAAAIVGIPRLMFVRPGWEMPVEGCIQVESLAAAAAAIPGLAKRVFLTIGRQDLASFAHLHDVWFLMRMVEPPDAEVIIPPGKLLLARGPFTETDERALLTGYKIEAIVSKNSGGEAAEAKLRAAQALKIPVVMVQRPQLPEGERVTTIEDALLWIINDGRLR